MKISSGISKIAQILDRQSKKSYYLLLLLLILKSTLDGFGLGLIAPFIAAVGKPSLIFNNETFQKINAYAGIETNQELVISMSVILLLFFIIKNIYTLSVTFYQSKLVFSQRAYLSRKLFEAYMHAPYRYHLDHNTAESDRNIRYEIPNTYAFIQSLLQIITSVFLIISIAIVLLIANWQAVLVMGLSLTIVSFLIFFITGKYSNKLGKQLQKSQLDIGQALKEGLSSIIETKVNNIESFFPERYLKHYLVTARMNWMQETIASLPTLFLEILAIGVLCGTLVILSLSESNIIDLLPIIGLFAVAFVRLIPAVNLILRHLSTIKFTLPAVNVIHSEFKKFGVSIKSGDKSNVSMHPSMQFDSLRLENINFSFDTKANNNVINNVSLQIEKGQIIGITGPSGSGKTTLLNIILGLLNPNSGKVLLNDQEIHDHQLVSRWRQIIGYVPQSITLIDATITENIALGMQASEIDKEKVNSVLKESHLYEFVNGLPEKTDTMIGENGVRLSGGQRQRLGLARALYKNAQVLVFDEATSSLDVASEKKITNEIMTFSGQRTIIFVTHRISTIKDSNTIYYLKNGQIKNSGTFSDLKEINEDFSDIVNKIDPSWQEEN